jgi:hypothetical protein
VPRAAKSQEVIGNRIVYGNYLQNYNVDKIDLSVNYAESLHTNVSFPEESLKTLRTYQVGVVFKDAYGRETPVVASKKSSIYLPVSSASSVNKLTVSATGDVPSWATHYKYFIKDISNEYYNLALDRFYPAEDGNVWLSFPSAERNKIDEESYLILKKQHDNDISIKELSKYKVLAIQSSPPAFVSEFNKYVADYDVTLTNEVEPSRTTLQFTGPTLDQNNAFATAFTSDNKLVIEYLGIATEEYDIASGGIVDGDDQYEVTLDEALGAETPVLAIDTQVRIRVYTTETKNLPEFEGRFFAKINRDAAFDTNIISSFSDLDANYGVRAEIDFERAYHPYLGDTENHYPGYHYGDHGSGWHGALANAKPHWYYLEGHGWGGFGSRMTPESDRGYRPPTQGHDTFGFVYIGKDVGDQKKINEILGRVGNRDQFITPNGILTAGAKIRFKNKSTGGYSQIYTIESVLSRFTWRGGRYYEWGSTYNSTRGFNRKLAVIITLNKEKEDEDFGWVNANDWSGLETILPSIQIVEPVNNDKNKLLTSSNPAIFETEPKEAVDIDLYHEASDALPISAFNYSTQLEYSNCFSYGNGVESNRIRDDYNAFTIDKGTKVSAPLDEPYIEERRSAGLIYSQIFNSMSGVNGLNQFIQAEKITKDLNPIYGSIQKLHARDTDLICLAEDKCFRILANKDALYNADGNTNVTSNFNVLGQATPYLGEFGISKNPESFASYGFRAYFTDKARGSVIRLSRDGIEEISIKGMSDFFTDNLPYANKLIGSYDDVENAYNLTLDNLSTEWQEKLQAGVFDRTNCSTSDDTSSNITETTLTFKEGSNGWESRKSFIQESGISLNGKYFTFKNGLIWEHKTNSLYNNFYGVQYDSSLNFIFNEAPTSVKVFKTLNYAGTKSRDYSYNVGGGTKKYNLAEIQASDLTPSNETVQPGWYTNWIKTDLQEGALKTFLDKEGKYFNYIKGLDTYFNTNCDNNVDSNEFSVQGIGRATVTGDVQSDFNVHLYIDGACFIADYNVHLYVDPNCEVPEEGA